MVLVCLQCQIAAGRSPDELQRGWNGEIALFCGTDRTKASNTEFQKECDKTPWAFGSVALTSAVTVPLVSSTVSTVRPSTTKGGQIGIPSHSLAAASSSPNNTPMIAGITVAVVLSAALAGASIWVYFIWRKRPISLDLNDEVPEEVEEGMRFPHRSSPDPKVAAASSTAGLSQAHVLQQMYVELPHPVPLHWGSHSASEDTISLRPIQVNADTSSVAPASPYSDGTAFMLAKAPRGPSLQLVESTSSRDVDIQDLASNVAARLVVSKLVAPPSYEVARNE